MKTYDFSGPPPPPPPDTTPPTAPAGRDGHSGEPTRVDRRGRVDGQPRVEGYKIKRDGVDLTTVTSGHVVVGHDGHARDDVHVQPSRPRRRPQHLGRDRRDGGDHADGRRLRDRVRPQGHRQHARRHELRRPDRSTSGDTLVAAIALQAGATASVASVTDSAGGTWTKGTVGFAVRLEHADRALVPHLRTAGVTSATVTLSRGKAAERQRRRVQRDRDDRGARRRRQHGDSDLDDRPAPAMTTTSAKTSSSASINYPGSPRRP